ncbi:MAG TPA: sigma-70 family RNA polymerase sigma factor [Thermoanaerobaculia bacterium]|nr:sigma-70 family RNA polymerase sigma factor [Thermoanaerobaculia bacterium]
MTLEFIVDRARNDDLPVDQQHAAFTELVRRFEEAAFAWALQLLGDPDEAKDATQDAFLTAWLKLRQLREPAAFGAWLKRLIATQCNRRLRKRVLTSVIPSEVEGPPTSSTVEGPSTSLGMTLARAMSRLSESEYRVVVLFYFLGRRLDEIASILGMPRGTVGKRLHCARIAIRRRLPRGMRFEFQRMQPISERLLDEYAGEYRFDERPELTVRIAREGKSLVSYSNGQRSVLASLRDEALVAMAFDAEGRFQRDRRGRVVQFTYYEFGARLGVAKKLLA